MKSLSEKQLLSLKDSDAKINIWQGSVRSGKTYISLWRFLDELINGPPGEYAMISRTYDSFKRNILPQITRMIGTDARYYAGKREMNIWGKTIFIVGADDERSESKIRGSTFSGAYVDEATIIPESVFKMLISRCAMGNAKIFATTNPDSPFHWFKRDYVDNNPDVKTWLFNLDDNPELSEDEKEYLRRQYKGIWYQRFIEGRWVQAEGAVYDFFDTSYHCIDFPPGLPTDRVVAIDYGTTNPCAFVMIGVNRNKFPHVWVEDEYYFDSKVHQRQKTDSEYADDLRRFIQNRPVKQIYIDPSAASFKLELVKQGFSGLIDAENEVLDGIRFVSKMFTNGTLKICRNCHHLIKEMQGYVWDAKSAKTGIDKPLKEQDHCFVADTLVLTENGYKYIKDIHEGEYVKTRSGFNKVLKTFINYSDVNTYNILGKNITCTESHPFLTYKGWRKSSELIQSDMFFVDIGETCQKSLISMVSDIDVIQTLKTSLMQLISEQEKLTAFEDLDIYIEIFGNTIMETFQKDTIFITKMEIPTTMTLAISSAFMDQNISQIIAIILMKSKERLEKIISTKSDHLLWNGTDPRKEEIGIERMERKHGNQLKEGKNVCVADQSTLPQKDQKQNFVRIVVSRNGEEIITLMTSKENVITAEKISKQTNMTNPLVAQDLVESYSAGKEKVYNLHVENEHEYIVEGILVHNCLDALRYGIYSHFFGKDLSTLSPRDIDRNWNEAMGIQPELPSFFQQPIEYGSGGFF